MKTTVSAEMAKVNDTLELVGNKGSVQVLKNGEVVKITANAGEKYRIVKKHGASDVLADDVIATKIGDTLQLQYADGTQVSLEGFYNAEGAELALPANDGGVHTVSSEMALSTDSSNFVYAHGDHNTLMSMTQSDHSLQMAVAEHTSVSNLPHFAELATGVATDAVAGTAGAGSAAAGTAAATGVAAGMSTATMVGLGALGVAGVAVAAGGGGGGSSAPAAAAADTTAPTLTGVLAHGVSKTIVLTYNEALSTTNLPLTTAFTVNTDGAGNVVTAVAVSGSTITLTLTSTFTAVNNISYADPTGGNDVNAIQDIAGNDAVAIVNLGSGVVADGYVRGAQIWIDTNNDGTADYNTGVTTDASGNFFLAPGTPTGSIVAIGGVNIDTGVPNTMPLRAPAGSTVINPLTTLVQAIIQANPGTSVATASASVVTSLGLTGGTDLSTYDPLAQNDVAAQKAAATVATIISIGAGSNAADTTTIIANLAQEIQTGTVIDLTDSTTLTNVLDGVTVSAQEISDIANATTSIDNAATLANIATAQSVALDTVAAGVSTLTASAVTNDATPEVRVNLNITSTDGTAVVTGDIVVLKVDGIQVDTHILIDADIIAGYVNIDSSTLTEGTHSISAVVVDKAGNISTAYPSVSIIIDTTAPTAPTVGAVTVDNVINLSEKTAGVTLTGTTESGSTVTVLGNAATVTGTTWSYTFTSANYTTMGEGAEAVSIVATDTAGNTATTTKNITVVTVASTVTAAITGAEDNVGSTVNIASAGTTDDNTLGLSGTISTTLGGGEVLAIYDGSTRLGEATVISTAWTFDTAALTNAAHSFTARVEDAAGNNGTSSSAYTLTVNATLPTATATVDTIGSTNDTTPAITGVVVGTLGGGDTVEVYVDGVYDGQATVSGSTWSYTPSALVAGIYSVSAVVQNNVGNQGTMSSAAAMTIDTTLPTVVITDDQTGTGNIAGGTILYTFTFSEAVTGFAVGDVAIVNGTAGTFTAISSTVYTLVVTPDAIEGDVTVDVAADIAIDAAGNNNTIATQSLQAVDMVAPTVLTITDVATNNAINAGEKTATIGVVVEGTAENSALVTLTLGTGNIKTVTADGTTGAWTYTLTAADYTSIAASSISGVTSITVTATDAAGNASTVVSKDITVDTVAPLLSPFTLTTATDSGTANDGKSNDATPDFTFTAETGATLEMKIGNGSFLNLNITGTGAVQTITAPTMSEGANVVTLRAMDGAGNTTERTLNFTLDTTIATPTATLTTDSGSSNSDNLTNDAALTFSTKATDVTRSFVVNGGTASATYVAPTVDGSHTVVVTDTDTAGNTATVTKTFTLDTFTPTFTSGITATVSENTTAAVYTAVATGAATYSLSGTDAALFNIDSVSGAVTFKVAPDFENPANGNTDNIYDITVTATDTAGNTSNKVVAITVENVDVTVNNVATDNIINAAEKTTGVTITGNNEPGISAVTVNGQNATVNGTSWSYALNAAAITAIGEGVQTLTIVSGGATIVKDITVDTVLPTVVITDDEASTGNIAGANITYTFTFSEAVTGFAVGDITVVGGIPGTLTPVSSTVYTLVVTPTAEFTGNVTVDVPANVAYDVPGNLNSAATQSVQAVDMLAPTIAAIDIDIVGGTNPSIVNATHIQGMQLSGTQAVGDTVSISGFVTGTKTTPTNGSNGTWSIPVIAGDVTQGTNHLTITVTDVAGNATTTTKDIVVDTIAPTVVITDDQTGTGNIAGGTILYTFTFSEDVAGLTIDDITVANGTKGTLTQVSQSVYTIVVTPTAEFTGNVTVDVPANVAYDVPGNLNSAATQSVQAVDMLAPTITIGTATPDNIINAAENAGTTKIASGTTDAENSSIVTVKVDGNIKGTTTAENGAWSLTYTTESNPLSDGAHVRTAEVTDAAGNTAIASREFTVDTVASALGYTLSNGTAAISNLESGASWEYQIDGGSFSPGTGSTFTIPTSGSHTFSIRQTDAAGNISTLSSGASVDGGNTPPNYTPYTMINNNTLLIAKGIPLNINLQNYVGDPDGDAIAITVNSSTLPAGLTITNGVITGTTTATTGTLNITLDDGRGGISNHTITLSAIDNPTTTELVYGAAATIDPTTNFFGIDDYDMGMFSLNIGDVVANLTNEGSYADYNFVNGAYVADVNDTGTFDVASTTATGATIIHGGTTETVVFSDAKAVTSVNGVTTTGLNSATATWTITAQTETVATSTDWWEDSYYHWDGTSSIPVTTLAGLRDELLSLNSFHSIWINDNTKVDPVGATGATSGTLVFKVWDGTYNTYTTVSGVEHTTEHLVVGDAVAGGTWAIETINGVEYLTVTVPNQGIHAFKAEGGVIMSTEIEAVGTSYSETVFYGVDLATFQSTIIATIANTTPDITAPILIDASFTVGNPTVMTLTFSEEILAGEETPTFLLNGTTSIAPSGVPVISGNTITISFAQALSASEYILMNSPSNAVTDLAGNPALSGIAIAGSSGASTIDLSTLNGSSDMVVFGSTGNDTIIGTNNQEYIVGGEGMDTIGSGYGTDIIDFYETTKVQDVIIITGENADHSKDYSPDYVKNFDVTGTGDNDAVGVGIVQIGANTGLSNGFDTGLVAQHSITAGIVSFFNTAGGAIIINKNTNYYDAIGYLEANLTYNNIVGFAMDTDNSGSADSLAVYQSNLWGETSVVILEGMNGKTLGTTSATDVVRIVDKVGPEINDVAIIDNNTLRLIFNEAVASTTMTDDNTDLQIGNGNAIGSIISGTYTTNNTTTFTIDTASTFGISDYILMTTTATITDIAGNVHAIFEPGEERIAFGNTQTSSIDFSALTGDYTILNVQSIANSTLKGGSGNDFIEGGTGADTITSGRGADDIMVGNGDTVIINQGDSTLVSFQDNYTSGVVSNGDTFTFANGFDHLDYWDATAGEISVVQLSAGMTNVTSLAGTGLIGEQQYALVQGWINNNTGVFTVGDNGEDSTLVVYDGIAGAGVSQMAFVLNNVADTQITSISGNTINTVI